MAFSKSALFAFAFIATPALAAPVKLDLVEHADTDKVSVKGGSAADNVGDILTFANPIYDATNTTKLGTDQGYCVRLILGQMLECHWTTTLANGQIMVDGPFSDTGDTVMAITGGTGVYSGARGEMLLHARDAKATGFDFHYSIK